MTTGELIEAIADIPEDYDLVTELVVTPSESYVYTNVEVIRLDGISQCVLRVLPVLSASIRRRSGK